MTSFIVKDSRAPYKIMHPSTKAALSALQLMAGQGVEVERALDIGTGSGILSLYTMNLWPDAHLLATDISKRAVEEARENIENNGFSERAEVIQAEGLDHPHIREFGPYELLIANLLAKFHVQYLGQMKPLLRAHGHIICSGVLTWRRQEVEQAIHHAGFDKIDVIAEEQWLTFIIANK